MTQSEIKTIAALAAVEALRVLGLTSGEVSHRRAQAVWGSDFARLAEAGLVRPCRYGRGPRAKRTYRVADILAAQAAEDAKAKIVENR